MPPTFSQSGRLMALTTPLGPDALLLEKLSGVEGISELFRFDLDVLAVSGTTISFDKLLGQSVTVTLQLSQGARYFNGIVRRVKQGSQVAGILGDVTFTLFRLEVVPRLWLWSQRRQSRIFQQLAVPDILKQVLQGLDVSWELQGTYEPRDYCTQYHESDFDFVSRLMEEEGIFYFFRHGEGTHKLVVADTPQSHVAVPGPARISYQPGMGGLHPDDRIFVWNRSQQITPGKVTLWDQCFELPNQNLHATKTIPNSLQVGTVSHQLAVGGNDALEVYEYPGRYAQRFDGVAPGGGDRADDVQKIFQDNVRTTGIRMQQETTPAILIEGEGNVRHLCAGHKFTLADHFDGNGDYVLTRVEHLANLEGVYTDTTPPEDAYASRFHCIPLSLPFRPPLTTPRPTIPGPQTAVVVGPEGEEIFTDKHGRVKVQFPWDREGQRDAGSSCWVRVGSLWAGKGWGSIWIPRVGHEVIVAFEDGDPDRPIVVGSVYNGENVPPYVLPDHRTVSCVKSRSTLEGDEQTFNELRFEDKKDSEEIYFHAEKDFNRVVENNDTLKVGFDKKDKGDQTIEIFNNQSLKVGAGEGDASDGSQTISVYKNRTTTIETGDEVLTIKQGKRTVTVETGDDSHVVSKGHRAVTVSTGNDTHVIDKGNREVEISLGNDTLTIKTGNQTVKLNAGASTLEAMQGITLKVGANSIKIDPSGITLSGVVIKLQGQAQVQVQAPIAQVQGDGMLQLQGGVAMIN